MIALSTSYFTLREQEPSGEGIVREASALGFRALEVDYRVTGAQLKTLAPHAARGEVDVVSVHHPLPRPPEVSPFSAHLDRVRLSSLDPDERRAAVRLGAETLLRARDLGAGVVVFHIGSVVLEDAVNPRQLERLLQEGKRDTAGYGDLKARVQAARRDAAPRHLDAVLSCLDRLAAEALRGGVSLGIENRYHPEEIPDREELSAIFRELGGAPIGYWHDTGHAESLTALGFLSSQTELLEAFGDRLLGFHLHDADGIEDHRAPGEGKLDFAALARFAKQDARLVLEIHPASAPESVARAPSVLVEAGFQPGAA